MLAHFDGKLPIGQLVGCFQLYLEAAKFLALDVFAEFSLGFTRTKDQQRVGASNERQHLFIDLVAAAHELSFPPIFHNEIIRSVFVLRA